jgi:hypothetical protein
MSDWDATERAAGALRGLNRAFNGVRIDDDALERLAVEIDALTARFATGTPRDKFEDMQTRPHLQQLYAGIHAPLDLEVGDPIEFDPFSIAGGQFHPASIGLEFRKESETSVTGTGVIDPMFAGPPERVHGGIQALVVDEVMGALNRMLGRQAFTARLTVNYRNPAPLGVPVTFRSWLGGVDGRKITLLATGEGPDGLFMEADGLFISRRPED